MCKFAEKMCLTNTEWYRIRNTGKYFLKISNFFFTFVTQKTHNFSGDSQQKMLKFHKTIFEANTSGSHKSDFCPFVLSRTFPSGEGWWRSLYIFEARSSYLSHLLRIIPLSWRIVAKNKATKNHDICHILTWRGKGTWVWDVNEED